MKRGLMSSHTRGKKQYFQGERPTALMHVVEDEKRRLTENQEKIKNILPKLEALISVTGATPEVNYYEGLEGLRMMREVLFSVRASELMIVGSPEKYQEVVSRDQVHLHNFNLKNSPLKVRQIVLYAKKSDLEPANKNAVWKFLKVKELETGEVSIFGDYVALIVYLDKPYGFLLKSKEIAMIIKKIFDTAWKKASVKP